jgi:hypothetical protein
MAAQRATGRAFMRSKREGGAERSTSALPASARASARQSAASSSSLTMAVCSADARLPRPGAAGLACNAHEARSPPGRAPASTPAPVAVAQGGQRFLTAVRRLCRQSTA